MKGLWLLLALPLAVQAGALPENECEHWRREGAGAPSLSVNDFTRERAERALEAIQAMVGDESGAFNLRYYRYRDSEGMIKGYLLRKELIDARANREHDGDEVIAFCLHWAEMAYEQ